MLLPLSLEYCLILKNQKCKVRKLITDNDYMLLIDVLEIVIIKIVLI